MRRVIVVSLVVLLAVTFGAHAQTSALISFDVPVTGVVSAEDAAPSYFFDGVTGEVVTVLIEPRDGLVPLILIAQADDNAVIGTVNGAPGLPRAFSVVTLRRDGQHFLQVQGATGTLGGFTLTISRGDAILTPTVAPIAETPLPVDGSLLTGSISAETPSLTYAIPPSDAAQIITVTAETFAPIRVVLVAAGGAVIAALDAPLFGGSLFIPPAQTGLRIRVEASSPVNFSIRAALFAPATPTPEPPPPTATLIPATATPIPASDVDLVVNWNSTSFVLTNVSGEFLDIHDVAFRGNDRMVDANVWDRTGTVNIFAVPPASCIGVRPLAFPDAPALPPDCEELASWWASDALAVWMGASFDVLYNGTVIQTCTGAIGQCLVDLPNA